MPIQGNGCFDDDPEHTSEEDEAQFRYILYTRDIGEITAWVFVISTYFELVWWNIKLLEMDTGERFTNAEQKAAWGTEQTDAIRVAGHRLKKKLIKVLLGTDEEPKSA
jgi:hypothetical protein